MSDSRKLALKEDEIVITKQDVLEMMNGLIIRWKRVAPKSKINKACIVFTIGLKATIRITPEPIIKEIWGTILKFFNKMIMYNQAMKGLANNDRYMQMTWEKFKKEIKEGNFD